MSSEDHSRYSPDPAHSIPLFIDTGPLFAYNYPNDSFHDDAVDIFNAITNNDVSWGPLITNDYVLDETFSHIEDVLDKEQALKVVRGIYSTESFKVKEVDQSVVKTTLEYVDERTDDGRFDGMGFTDWVIFTQMKEHRTDIEHLFTYDREDFSAVDVTVIPYHTL